MNIFTKAPRALDNLRRRRLVTGALMGAVGAACLPAACLAQAGTLFPQRTVKLIVPFPPGGSTDALARQIAEQLAVKWKQAVVVENRPGGNTILGTDAVAKSAPDGHTLGIVTGSHAVNPLLTDKLPYDTQKDTTGVMLLTRFQMAMYAHPSLPANTPAELIALAKKSPGKLGYATATTQSYLGVELLDSMAGIQMQHIPYKGSGQALNDLLGGHIQLLVDPLAQGPLGHAHNGKLKLIGILGTSPSPLAPNAPTFSSVVPGYDYSSAFGLIARAGTPPDVIRRIRDDIAAVMKMPEVATRIRDIGQEPVASTPEEYNAFLVAEARKWAPVIKATGVRID
jgi:tripartite-type tricarboxylate transporter receptor subunit TctC